jgi:hypothetical protein
MATTLHTSIPALILAPLSKANKAKALCGAASETADWAGTSGKVHKHCQSLTALSTLTNVKLKPKLIRRDFRFSRRAV